MAARQGDHTCSQITNLAISRLNCAERFSQRIRDFAPSPYQLRIRAHSSALPTNMPNMPYMCKQPYELKTLYFLTPGEFLHNHLEFN